SKKVRGASIRRTDGREPRVNRVGSDPLLSGTLMSSLSSSSDVQILLLEDVAADADLLKDALEKSAFSPAIRQVDRREEFVKALEDLRPDIILADHALPAFRNDEALALAKRRYPDVPFIFVSG